MSVPSTTRIHTDSVIPPLAPLLIVADRPRPKPVRHFQMAPRISGGQSDSDDDEQQRPDMQFPSDLFPHDFIEHIRGRGGRETGDEREGQTVKEGTTTTILGFPPTALFHLLSHLRPSNPSPSQSTPSFVLCLHPSSDALHASLRTASPVLPLPEDTIQTQSALAHVHFLFPPDLTSATAILSTIHPPPSLSPAPTSDIPAPNKNVNEPGLRPAQLQALIIVDPHRWITPESSLSQLTTFLALARALVHRYNQGPSSETIMPARLILFDSDLDKHAQPLAIIPSSSVVPHEAVRVVSRRMTTLGTILRQFSDRSYTLSPSQGPCHQLSLTSSRLITAIATDREDFSDEDCQTKASHVLECHFQSHKQTRRYFLQCPTTDVDKESGADELGVQWDSSIAGAGHQTRHKKWYILGHVGPMRPMDSSE